MGKRFKPSLFRSPSKSKTAFHQKKKGGKKSKLSAPKIPAQVSCTVIQALCCVGCVMFFVCVVSLIMRYCAAARYVAERAVICCALQVVYYYLCILCSLVHR